MKKLMSFISGLIVATAMMRVTNSTEHMQPVHAMVTLIMQLCLCLAMGALFIRAVLHKSKYRVLLSKT